MRLIPRRLFAFVEGLSDPFAPVPPGTPVAQPQRFLFGQMRPFSRFMVLAGVDLTIAAGVRIEVVGPSGKGKSPLVNLILRLRDPEGGRILIDGKDIADVTQDSLRGQMGRIVVLDHGRVAEQVAYAALLNNAGIYARFWARQSGGFIGLEEEAVE